MGKRYRGVNKVTFIFVGLLLFIPSFEVSPCTLFGAIGDRVEGGGTLIAKARDLARDLEQAWIQMVPQEGYRYQGIASKGTKHVTSGINEKGLVVVSAAAPGPKKGRKVTPVGKILSNASSVDEVIALVQEGQIQGPIYYLVGDIHKIALLEVIDGYQFGFLIQENGVLSHTNHFILKDMEKMNRKIGRSSQARLSRIENLLNKGLLTKDRFIAFAQDHFNGPGDNSICRHFEAGIPSSEETVSATVYHLSKKGPPEIWVNLKKPCQSVFERK
jgi:isopenicillin-N N-acyltransferase-like protein